MLEYFLYSTLGHALPPFLNLGKLLILKVSDENRIISVNIYKINALCNVSDGKNLCVSQRINAADISGAPIQIQTY